MNKYILFIEFDPYKIEVSRLNVHKSFIDEIEVQSKQDRLLFYNMCDTIKKYGIRLEYCEGHKKGYGDTMIDESLSLYRVEETKANIKKIIKLIIDTQQKLKLGSISYFQRTEGWRKKPESIILHDEDIVELSEQFYNCKNVETINLNLTSLEFAHILNVINNKLYEINKDLKKYESMKVKLDSAVYKEKILQEEYNNLKGIQIRLENTI